MTELQVLPVGGMGDVTPGDDLAELIAVAAPWLRDGDVLVVTSKIVSKAEGRLVDVPAEEGPERELARAEVLRAETARTVARRGPTHIVQTQHGFVLANAGIDASNISPAQVVLLPKDPDSSARWLRTALRERLGVDVAVIISDTMGRPWRNGLTDVALGAAGIAAIRDHRGEVDPYGNELQVTQMAVIDELAGAGELVKGKRDGVPVAVVRGYLAPESGGQPDGAGAAALIREAALDMFSLGTAEARAAGLRAAAGLDVTPFSAEPVAGVAGAELVGSVAGAEPVGSAAGAEPVGSAAGAEPVGSAAAVERAIAVAARSVAAGTVITHETDPAVRQQLRAARRDWPAGAAEVVSCTLSTSDGSGSPRADLGDDWSGLDASALIRFGADLHRLRVALAAEGLASLVLPNGAPTHAVLAVGTAAA